VLGGTVTGTYTLASPTLSGTVAGTPTWASIQTIPAVTTTTAIGAGTPTANTLYKENIVKGWIVIDGISAPAVSLEDFNVSGFADSGTGRWTITWDVDFATDVYGVNVTPAGTDGVSRFGWVLSTGKVAGSVEVRVTNTTPALVDTTEIYVIAYGAQ
jgi:hypothetical protein